MNPGKNGNNGPKTFAGKARSSRNSRTHGLFERKLRLSEEEQTQHDQLNNELAQELQPTTAVQRLLFEDVLACAWRMKRALRCEQTQVQECFATDEEKKDTRPLESAPMGCHYSSLAPELRRRQLKFLEELERRFQTYPLVSKYPEIEKEITDLFGIQFWKTLIEWEPADPWALNIAMLARHRNEAYDTQLPGAPNPEARQRLIKADEKARMQMMRKLVERERQHVLLAMQQNSRDAQGGIDHQAQRLDLSLRYQTKARRDFYHALREYRSLKEAEKSAR